MYGGFINPNPNVITLTSAGATFDNSLPARLAGLVEPQEFAASIGRCNQAFSPGLLNAARLLIFGGLVGWAVCFGLAFAGASTDEGFNPSLMFVGFGVMMVCVIGGGIWARAINTSRVEGLQRAVSAENAYYNSAERAQRRGQAGPPISWTMLATPIISWGYRRSRLQTICSIQIEIGGAYMPPAMIVQQQYVQQPAMGYHQQAQPQYASPYQGAPAAYPAQQVYQSAPAPAAGGDQSRAPLLAHQQTSEGYEQPAAVVVGTCDRCARTTTNPADRFCSSCGGQFRA
jgi:hypothetical protein